MIFTNFTNSIVFYWRENFHGIQWANELYCLGGEKTKYQKIFHLIDRHISYSGSFLYKGLSKNDVIHFLIFLPLPPLVTHFTI